MLARRKMLQTYESSVEEPQPSSSSATTEIQSATVVDNRRSPLRQQHNLQADGTHHGNRIIDLDLLISNMNQVYFEHQTHAEKCKNLNLSLHKDYKEGLAVGLQFTCVTCQFVSSRLNMYRLSVNSKGSAINLLLT